MLCPSCGADLPDDAQFCIECGVSLGDKANTGRTINLPRQTTVVEICRACGAANPDHASFCVRCGHRLSEPAPIISRPLSEPSLPTAPRRAASGGYARPTPRAARPDRRSRARWEAGGAALFLISLGGLLLLKAPFLPALFVAIGLNSLVRDASRGRIAKGMRNVIWLFGLAFLFFMPKLFFPGILVLVGVSIALEMILRNRP